MNSVREELPEGWKFKTFNHYHGRVYQHPEAIAIELFNYYYQSIGFEVFLKKEGESTGGFLGKVKSPSELP